jgi:hypothetical protein
MPYSGLAQYDAYPIIVKANATAPGAATVTITKAGITFLGSCSTLPVTFSSFTAKRDQSTVALQWETSFEQNNRGFGLERNTNGTWTQVAFIQSQAAGGNSNAKLIYKYDDLNPTKAVSQYRIRQVDFDGVFKYSEVRSVFGEEQMARTSIYPNPSNDGKVNIIFDEINRIRDISVIDMAGRVIKQWKATSNNNLQIDNLLPGIYSLRVVDRETGKQSVDKILINGR